MPDSGIDPIELEVVKASLGGIVQEMQNSLFRTGFSTIVRESQDASCALMNAAPRWWRSTWCCRCISALFRPAARRSCASSPTTSPKATRS